MLQQSKKRIIILITHSLGEIDVLLPLFASVNVKHDVDVEIVFAVKTIYRQFESNDFYKFCAKKIDIKITSCQLPNKFDYRDSILVQNVLCRRLIKYYFKMLLIIKYPFIFVKLFLADVYMHETSDQKNSTFLLHKAASIFGKTIFIYHHGHSLNQAKTDSKKVFRSDEYILLLFHQLNKDWADSIGYTNQYVIGFPKFYKEWIDLIQQYNLSKYHGREIVVIYSRAAGHRVYMDFDKYIALFIESYKVIRKKMDNILIVIKPHPREDVNYIRGIIKKYDLVNVVISHEQAGVLARNAILTITFFSSAILDPLSLGVPSVEFYKEAKNFRLSEPLGSPYKNIGIDSVDCKEDLENFIETVISGNYKIPNVIDEISRLKDVEFLEAC